MPKTFARALPRRSGCMRWMPSGEAPCCWGSRTTRATRLFRPHGGSRFLVEDNHRSLALALLVFTTHVFRMTTFFLPSLG